MKKIVFAIIITTLACRKEMQGPKELEAETQTEVYNIRWGDGPGEDRYSDSAALQRAIDEVLSKRTTEENGIAKPNCIICQYREE